MLHVETAGVVGAARRGLLLHGAFGRGRNLRSLAQGLAERQGGSSWLLPDLRGHGASPVGDPPHTLDACAGDLLALGAFQEVIGHSLGGKVALAVAARRPAALERVVVIDADPGTRAPSGEAWEMLERLRTLPGSFPSREAAIRALEAAGAAAAVATWMATSLRREAGAFRFPF